MDWFRWHHGTVNDPKWRVVAKRSGCRVGDVIAVWATMLEDASANATERGELHGWCAEDIAALLDLEVEQVEAIRSSMEGKVLAGDKLTGWGRRQPKREDGSAERARAWRERQKAEAEPDKPPPNATERKRTPDKSREDKRINETEPPPWFDEAWSIYPKRAGGNSRKAAEKAWAASMKRGADPKDMLAGTRRYRDYAEATGKAGTEYVKQAATFYGPGEHWAEDWTAPEEPTNGNHGQPVAVWTEEEYAAWSQPR